MPYSILFYSILFYSISKPTSLTRWVASAEIPDSYYLELAILKQSLLYFRFSLVMIIMALSFNHEIYPLAIILLQWNGIVEFNPDCKNKIYRHGTSYWSLYTYAL